MTGRRARDRSLPLALLACGLFLAAPGPAGAQAPSDSSALALARADAVQALQGVGDSLALDPDDVEAVARALLAIREEIPELRDIRPYFDDSYLVVTLTDEARGRIAEPGEAVGVAPRETTVARLGLPGLDSLNEALGVDSVGMVSFAYDLRYLRPRLPFQPNVPAVAALYQALPEVLVAGSDHWNRIGPSRGDAVRHLRKDGLWQFVFVRARGDCPAGCTEHDWYYVAWDPARGAAELVDRVMEGEERDEPVPLWGIPRTLTSAPFETHEDVLARLDDARWWVRRHAADVAGLLLRHDERLWREARVEDHVRAADERESAPAGTAAARPESVARLERLVRDVGAHRREVALALAERVADEDRDVRAAARAALVGLSPVDHGEGEGARARWRAWVADGGWRTPPPAYVEEDTCEGELCSKVEGLRMLEPVDARAEPSLEAPVAFRLKRGDAVDLLTTDLHHVWTGRVILRDSVRIEEPAEGGPLFFARGDTVDVLGYRGEGYYGVLWRGEVRDVRAFWPLPFEWPPRMGEPGFLDRESHTHTWHRVRAADGRDGWVLHDPRAMESFGAAVGPARGHEGKSYPRARAPAYVGKPPRGPTSRRRPHPPPEDPMAPEPTRATDAQIAGAEAYEALHVPALMEEWTSPVLDAAGVGPGDRVLDVACGTGVLARAALARVGRDGEVAGVDADPGMLAVAERIEPAVEWRLGRAETLSFADASFDAVVSQFGMMFFQDRVQAAREMLRVLDEGGRLAVAVWDALDRQPAYALEVDLLEARAGTAAADALRAPFVLGDPDEVAAVFEEAGAEGVAVTSRTGTARFPSIQALVGADLRGWLPIMGVNLSEERIADILDQAERVLAPFATDDGVVFDSPAHIVSARKG